MNNALVSARNVGKIFRARIAEEGWGPRLRSWVAPRYTEHQALKPLDLTLGEGECIGLLGANGAGKSTLTKILTGTLRPSQGQVRVLGFSPHERKSAYLRQIGAVFGHKSSLWWDLPVGESFEATRVIYDIENSSYRRVLKDLVERLSLESVLDRPVRQLSLGERVKAELANSLLHQPRVVFLDEPTVGLDLASKYQIRDYLNRARNETGLGVLLTSHDTGDIESCCNRVMILHRGELRFEGSLEDLRRSSPSIDQDSRLESVLLAKYELLGEA